MQFNELKQAVAVISADDRLALTAYLRHLDRVDTDANREALSEANRQIDAGDFVTLEQLRRVHAILLAEGL